MRSFFRLFTTILFLLSTACFKQPTMSLSQPALNPNKLSSSYFPLTPGAYWIYKGKVQYTPVGSADVVEKSIQWKMEVVKMIKWDQVIGYEMLGAPWELAWYQDGLQPSRYAIIQIGTERFYRTTIETMSRLLNDQDSLDALVTADELFLDSPLTSGKKFCAETQIARPDNMYCWVVGSPAKANLKDVKGLNPGNELLAYPVTQVTLPDTSTYTFVPGVGITGYSYAHHGTISECDIHLVEFHAGE
jgi:hypothetical protein